MSLSLLPQNALIGLITYGKMVGFPLVLDVAHSRASVSLPSIVEGYVSSCTDLLESFVVWNVYALAGLNFHTQIRVPYCHLWWSQWPWHRVLACKSCVHCQFNGRNAWKNCFVWKCPALEQMGSNWALAMCVADWVMNVLLARTWLVVRCVIREVGQSQKASQVVATTRGMPLVPLCKVLSELTYLLLKFGGFLSLQAAFVNNIGNTCIILYCHAGCEIPVNKAKCWDPQWNWKTWRDLEKFCIPFCWSMYFSGAVQIMGQVPHGRTGYGVGLLSSRWNMLFAFVFGSFTVCGWLLLFVLFPFVFIFFRFMCTSWVVRASARVMYSVAPRITRPSRSRYGILACVAQCVCVHTVGQGLCYDKLSWFCCGSSWSFVIFT